MLRLSSAVCQVEATTSLRQGLNDPKNEIVLQRTILVLKRLGVSRAVARAMSRSTHEDGVTAPCVLKIVNKGKSSVRALWVDFNAREQEYMCVSPGHARPQQTYSTHLWRLRCADTGAIAGEYAGTFSTTCGRCNGSVGRILGPWWVLRLFVFCSTGTRTLNWPWRSISTRNCWPRVLRNPDNHSTKSVVPRLPRAWHGPRLAQRSG